MITHALLSVMAMCKESMRKNEDPFVRIVTYAPEPMSILCTNAQLLDIEHFCTDHTVLSVDPTFNLGDFSLTVTSYRNLLFKNYRTKNHPVMIGPMLVHRKKLFRSYHFLASSLVSLKPSLSQLQAFGTDGYIRHFQSNFPMQDICVVFLHFRDNCKAKLLEMKVSSDNVISIIQYILSRAKRVLLVLMMLVSLSRRLSR